MSSECEFETSVLEGATAAIVDIKGDLDSSAAFNLESQLSSLPEGVTTLILDFSKVSMINSTGMGVLIALSGEFSAKGGALTICGGNANVQRAMELVGISALFDIVATREQALAGAS